MVKKNKTEKNTDFFCPAAVLKKSKKTVRETQKKKSLFLSLFLLSSILKRVARFYNMKINNGKLNITTFCLFCCDYLVLCSSFYPPKSCFRILIQFLESKISFSGNISPFYAMIYNSKSWIRFLNTDLDSKLKLRY